MACWNTIAAAGASLRPRPCRPPSDPAHADRPRGSGHSRRPLQPAHVFACEAPRLSGLFIQCRVEFQMECAAAFGNLWMAVGWLTRNCL